MCSCPHTMTYIQWYTYNDLHTVTYIQLPTPTYSDAHTVTYIQWPTPSYSDAHTIQHDVSWLFYYRWTINMALQTASDLFRVRSSFDSGDLYEVFLKVWATKCHWVFMETMLYEGGFTQVVLSIFIKACTNSKHDSHCFTVLASQVGYQRRQHDTASFQPPLVSCTHSLHQNNKYQNKNQKLKTTLFAPEVPLKTIQ